MTTGITWVSRASGDTKAGFTHEAPRMRQMKHLALAAATAAALVLAGCGGSSSTTATTPQEPMAPTMDDAAQLATLQAAHKAAMDALNKLKDDLTDATQAEVDDAEAKLAALKAALTAATGVTAATKRLYSATGIEADLAKAKEDAAPALAAMNDAEKAIAAARTKAKAALDAAEVAKDLAADGREATDDTEAKTGSKEAQRVAGDFVALQTGDDPTGIAAKAKDAADKAMAEYEKAKDAYAAAMAATTKAAAEKAQRNAEAARDKAREYAMTANTEAMKAVQAGMKALRYDAGTKTYSTGEGNAKRSVLVGAGARTGNIDVDHPGRASEDLLPDTDNGKEVIRVAWRRMKMGNIYSNRTDDLYLFNRYFDDGGGKAKLYVVTNPPWGTGNKPPADLTDPTDHTAMLIAVRGRSTDSPGYTILSNGNKAYLVHVTDPSYHKFRDGEDVDQGASYTLKEFLSNSPPGAGESGIAAPSDSHNEGDLYYFTDENGRRIYISVTTDRNQNPLRGGVMYGRLTYVYPSDKKNFVPGENLKETEIPVQPAPIPLLYDHEYIHYGIWNTLKADADGTGSPLDMGIGFIRMLEGAVKTPVAGRLEGTATYQGGWAATVRAEGEDNPAFTRHSGMSKVTANFGDNSLTVDLTSLNLTDAELAEHNEYVEEDTTQVETFAKLAGTIDGTDFSGVKVTDVGDIGGMEATADGAGFTGEFSGAFYGPEAEEVGGVFDFDGEKKGAFRGAFGGGRNKK